MAEIATSIEVVSSNIYMMAHMLDSGQLPSWSDEMFAKTRVTSFFATDKAVECTNRALELMGAHGYSQKGGVEKHWRDSKMLQLWMGSRQLDMIYITRYYFECETLGSEIPEG